ncbi:MAG: hypothetical protein IJ165_06090 [Proteobacteria bacterium]|nr:hypothetical protein [Pseudomonadota bacterium]
MKSFGKRRGLLVCAAVALAASFAACSDDSGTSTHSCDKLTCPAGQVCNPKTVTCETPAVCGEETCAPGQVCDLEGRCADAGSNGCAEGMIPCGGTCVDGRSDNSNCGACGKACVDGRSCVEGECVVQCDPGWKACGDICVNIQTDTNNCGACGTVCDAGAQTDADGQVTQLGSGKVCVESKCMCPEGQIDCGGTCVDTASDVRNCGGCGQACEPGEICAEGGCDIYCTSSQTKCEGRCVLTNSDSENCGSCGHACDAGEICSQGKCEPVCGEGLTDCDGVCTDIKSTRTDCGSCGHACDEGQVCHAGECVATCGTLTACEGNCIDPQTDERYCGAKGKCSSEDAKDADFKGILCAEGLVCNGGECVCPEGKISCKIGTDDQGAAVMACIDAASDEAHCGCSAEQEGMQCGTLVHTNEGASCSEGTCKYECAEGFGDCDLKTETGCEADFLSDTSNCGGCGHVCASEHATEVACVFGACAPSCEDGFASCGGTCIDLTSNNENCGACGNACGEGFSCQDSYCVLTECTEDDGKFAPVKLGDKSVKAYCVKDADEFLAIRDALNNGGKYPDASNEDNAYILLDNISLSIQPAWRGIGTAEKPFSGIFLGNGKTVTGSLSCTSSNCGLFGYISKATIASFLISAPVYSVGTVSNVGAVAGYAADSTIAYTNVTGDVSGASHVGGIAGRTKGGNILACRMSGNVTGSEANIGGIAGLSESTEIKDSAMISASVSGNANVGGIVGSASEVTVDGCAFSNAKLSNIQSNTGGIAGISAHSRYTNTRASGRVIKSVAYAALFVGNSDQDVFESNLVESGAVISTGNDIGGFAGYASKSSFKNCKLSADVTGIGSNVGGFVGRSENASTYKNCHAESSTTGQMYLGGFVGNSSGNSSYDNCSAQGSATSTLTEAVAFSRTAIGGFCGYSTSSQFMNTTAAVDVKGTGYIGGHTGNCYNSTFMDSHASGKVTSVGTGRAGGFVGEPIGATNFDRCTASGNVVSNTELVGGFIGVASNYTGKLTRCAAYGSTQGTTGAGSFIGAIWYGNGASTHVTVDTCFALGDVKSGASRYAGGFVGGSVTGNNYSLYISDSYTSGFVSNTSEYHGSIVGYSYPNTTQISDVYYWNLGSDKVSNGSEFISGSKYKEFSYSDGSAVVNENKVQTSLTEILNNNQNAWEEAKCKLISGPVNKFDNEKFTIPVLKGMKPAFCD